MRTFVAVELSDALRDDLRRAQSALRRHVDGVRWVRAETIHLTLKFLGEVAESDLPALCEAVRNAAEAAKPFTLRRQGFGAFPSARRPRVLWAGADAEPPEPAGLHDRLDAALARLGVPRETKGFRAHLTLGRIQRPRAMEGLEERFRELGEAPPGETQVTEIVFMQSDLTPQGPVYTPVARFALG